MSGATWLPAAADAGTPFGRVLDLCPDLAAGFHEFHSLPWSRRLVDPVLLDLCRLRMATLLGCAAEQRVRYRQAVDAGLTEEIVAALPQWPTSPLFDAAARACLALAEQFLLDPSRIDDELRAGVLEQLGAAGTVALLQALALFDGFLRFRKLLLLDDGVSTEPVVVDPLRWASLP